MSLLADTALPRSAVEEFRNYIDGEWVGSASREWLDNINPADTSDIVGRFPASNATEADAAVRAAAAAFAAWRKTPITARARILNKAADYLEAHVGRFASELTRELWEPVLREAQQTGDIAADVDIVELCEWIAHLEIMFISQLEDTPEAVAWVRRMVEHFVVPAITPRN